MHSRRRVNRRYMRGSTKEFFNPVIPTQNFVQSRNPEGYFWHPTSQAYFQSRNTPRFCFQILNPELQISGCLKTYQGPSYAVWQDFWKRSYRTKQTCSHLSENRPKGKFHASHKSKITLRKEKERKNRESKDKRRRRKKKQWLYFSVYIRFFGDGDERDLFWQ